MSSEADKDLAVAIIKAHVDYEARPDRKRFHEVRDELATAIEAWRWWSQDQEQP